METSRRQAGTIGAAGGSVTTTSGAGVTYTLEVPPDALPGDVEIAITPVTSIGNLPLVARLEGAVQLGPSGLELLKPAVLTIAKAPSTSGSEALVGFGYQGNADSFNPTAAIHGTTEIRLLVSHFSGAGAMSGEATAVESWTTQACAGIPTSDRPFFEQLSVCSDDPTAPLDWLVSFGGDYLTVVVLPLVQSEDQLSAGVAEYIEWYWGCDAFAEIYNLPDWESALASQIATIQDLVETELVAAVAGEKSALCSQGGPAHLRQLFEYRRLAEAAGLDDVTGLRDEDLLDGLCAEIRIPELTLADPMPMNQGTSLDARAELWINDVREDGLFRFTVNTLGTNVTCGTGETNCSGNSNGLGEYTQVVTRTGPGLVELDVFASLMVFLDAGPIGAWVETPLVGVESVERESYAIEATFPNEVEPGQAATLTAVVTRDNDPGSPQPIEGALVTFAVDGGSADPLQGTSNVSGSVSTQVTANDGPNRVVVDIEAWVNGIRVATKTVEATIQSTEPTGTLMLHSRTTQVLAWVPDLSECTGDKGGQTNSSALGPIDVTEDANISCTFPPCGPGQAQVSHHQVSDPGFATDGSSALMSFVTTASASTQAADPCFTEAAFVGDMRTVFQVMEGTVTYEMEATFSGTVGDATVHMDGGSTFVNWNKKAGDGLPNTFTASGTLSPGYYAADFVVVGELRSNTASASGTFGMTATIRLTAASPAAAEESTTDD